MCQPLLFFELLIHCSHSLQQSLQEALSILIPKFNFGIVQVGNYFHSVKLEATSTKVFVSFATGVVKFFTPKWV